MASSSSHAPERSKVEQIVVEFFAKSLHIILESRIPALGGESDYLGSSASSSNSGPKTRDRWFNLALGDCTAALENFEPWRRSLSDPMVVDILLYNSSVIESKPSGPPVGTSEHLSWEKAGTSLEHEDSSMVNKPTTLERWTVQFDQRKRTNAFSSSQALKVASRVKQATERDAGRLGSGETHEAQVDTKKEDAVSGLRLQKAGVDESRGKGEASLPAHVTEVSAVYKRTVIMLRSLYSTCRLLPAYRIFKMSSSSTNCCDFYLDYRMLSTVTPLTEHDNRDMSVFSFTPVETAFGRMSLSVQYRLSTSVIELRVVPSILPRIIPDYVGSPTTDPLKRFTGEPHSLPASGMCLGQGMHLIALRSSLQNSPPYPGLDRRHSWSGRIHQMQPALQPPSSPSYRISRSPSPSYPFHPSPPHTPSYSPLSCKQQCSDLSPSPITSPHSSADRHTGIGIKASQPISIDRHLSPPFSPSPSPSPPTLYRGSDPVSIPRPSQLRGSKLSMGDPHQRSSRNLLPPLSTSSRKAGVILRSSSESPRHSGHLLHALQSRSFESSSQLQTLHGDRCNQIWINEGPPYTSENSLLGQQTFSGSSSKTALGDDGEDDDFSCPFAVDDVDGEEKKGRDEAPGSSASSGSMQQRSPDAAVGALIRIINSAPPLRHSSHTAVEAEALMIGGVERNVDRTPRSASPEIRTRLSSTEFPDRKMAAEALEELQLYKNLRDLMLMRQDDVKLVSSGINASPG